MATSNRLTPLFRALYRQYRRQWTLPLPDALGDAIGDERVITAVVRLSQLLNSGRLPFADWQTAVKAALQRGGIDVTPLLAAAAVAVGAGVILSGQRGLREQTDLPEQVLDALRERFLERVVNLTEALAAGRIDVPTWQAAFLAELDVYHPAAAIVGANGSRDPRVLALGRERAARERAYLDAWASDLQANGLSNRRKLLSRARLYAGAGSASFYGGMATARGIVLPQQPGDGQTICRTQCKCTLRFEDAAGGVNVYWILHADESCPDCIELARVWNPLFIETRAA